MKVIKFGGAVFTRKEAFANFRDILISRNERVLVVISAFGKITSQLKKAAVLAESGSIGYNKIISEVELLHSGLADQIFKNNISKYKFKQYFGSEIEYLKKILKGIEITSDLSYRTMDMVMSFGESFALEFLHLYLNENKIDNIKLDSKEIVITDKNFGKAKPDRNETGKRLKNAIESNPDTGCFIIQGFVASTKDNIVTTMGMESSNLTAILCADILSCSSIDIYTNVEGIMQADPERFPDAQNIQTSDYNTALSAGIKGLKLIYPDMIDFAKNSNVIITFRSIFNKSGRNTVISESISSDLPIIIRIDKLEILYLRKSLSDSIKKINESCRNKILFTWEENNYLYFVLNTNGSNKDIDLENTKVIKNWCRISVINNSTDKFIKIINKLSHGMSGKDYRIFLNGANNEISVFTDIETGKLIETEIFNIIND